MKEKKDQKGCKQHDDKKFDSYNELQTNHLFKKQTAVSGSIS
jgi:hypothetical protein